MSDTFKCFNCKGIFEKAWSDEEARQEASAIFGDIERWASKQVEVCDDCYQLMHPSDNPDLVKRFRVES